MALLLAGLAGFSAAALIIAGAYYWTYDPQLLVRLEKLDLHSPVPSLREVEMAQPILQRLLRPQLARLGQILHRYSPQGYRDRVRARLLLAGTPWRLQTSEFLAIKLLLALLSSLTVFFYYLHSPVFPLFPALLAAGGGWALPELFLRRRIDGRQKQIRNALSDTLDLLTVSVEAGLGFDAALAKVEEKTKGPLAEEFGVLLQEIRVGKPRRIALGDLARRTGVEDLAAFVAAVIQADQLGVSISNVLRIQAEEMRRKRRQRAEERAMKVPIKMLFPLVLFIFPALFVVLLGPAVIQMIEALGSF
ncbi:MAG: type II secretion system F family protein [Limnochordia bacterium]|jgi:tight adherence protein C